MKLVLFDFDGTLTTKDSFVSFIRFTNTKKQFYAGVIKYTRKLLLYKARLYDGSKLKQEVLSFFFNGLTEEKITQFGEDFNKEIIPSLLHKSVINQLLEYRSQGHKIVIVSASLDVWLIPFAKEYNIDLICTELKFVNHIFKGEFKTPNCNFIEKKIRVKKLYNLGEYDEVIAFGNSSGDKYLFELADIKIKV